jgi:hypothetical protein
MLCEEFFSSINEKEEILRKLQSEVPIDYNPSHNEIFKQNNINNGNNLDNGNKENIDLTLKKEKSDKKGMRMIFFSNDLENYNETEKQSIDELVNYLKKDKEIYKVLEKDPSVIFDIYRFHYHLDFDLEETKKRTLEYLSIFKEGFPVNKNYLKLIKLGYIYTQGRDKQYIPNIVFDVNRLLDNIDKIEYSDFMRSVLFVLEFVIKFQFVRGKVETWNLILNLDIHNNFENEVFKLKYFYSQITALVKKFYPNRTNNIYVYLRTEDFYLRSNDKNYDFMVFNFFRDFLNNELIRSVYIIDHELTSSSYQYIKQYSFETISLLTFFNEYICKSVLEEKYFGSLKNNKHFFEFVNSKLILFFKLIKL